MEQTDTEVADASAMKPASSLDSSASPDSATTSTPAAQPDAATAQTKPTHHHKKKSTATEEPAAVAGTTRAQPVQDFDTPASTFASCPVPIPVETHAEVVAERKRENPSATPAAPAPAPVAEEKTPAPSAPSDTQSSSPEVAATPAPEKPVATEAETPAPVASPVTESEPTHGDAISSQSQSSKHPNNSFVTDSTPDNDENTSDSSSVSDWAHRFRLQAENLANRGIAYDEDWCPPGEAHSWAMDCSNTSRYLYKVTTGIDLPRTASDQYYYLHLQNKAWDVPQAANGFADCDYLRERLKPGDLLFWENTYKPERQPPITHVMIFLGTNEKGQWIMVGSQTSRGGLHNRRHGGPDIYVFDPTKPCGGYSTWLGLVHHQGRFCAFGRPLEADRTKLSVANN
jgi:cell wall-associated NlpC family hydrolase